MHSTLTVQDKFAVVIVGRAVKLVVVVLVADWVKVITSEFTVTVPAQSVPDKVIFRRNKTVGFVPVKMSVAADAPLKRVQFVFVTRYAVDFNPGTN
jgi:hypothetical protein